MKHDKVANEQGTKTVLNLLSSKVFFYLPFVFIFIPLFFILMITKSKTLTALLVLNDKNISLVLPGIIFIALIIIADCIAFLAMRKLYNSSFSINKTNKNIFICFTFLQIFSLIAAVILAFFTILLFFGIIDENHILSNLLFPYNLDKQFVLPWSTKIFIFLILLAVNFLFCIGLTRWILSVEKTFKTDKIYVNGTAFLNKMAIANCVIIFINLIIMLIEQDWFYVLFLLSMLIFNITIIFNTMKYFKLCNKSLATQYDDYIAELHEEKEIEYYNPFTDHIDNIFQRNNFPKDEPYKMDPSFQRFDFYVSSATETEIETDSKPNTYTTRACPVCQYLLHGKNICPNCGHKL